MNTRWFGKAWNPEQLEAVKVPVPLGERCLWCLEGFRVQDSGLRIEVLMPAGRTDAPVHADCFARMTIGGIYHQQCLCTCFGGALGQDPPSLSRREAARVAATHYRLQVQRKAGAKLRAEDLGSEVSTEDPEP